MGSEEANVSEDVLKTYEFHVQVAEEDVRDGDANPWERVVADLAAEVRRMRENEVCADTECRDLKIRDLTAEVLALQKELVTWKDIVAGGRVANKELNTRIAQLQEQVAELETDAKLGRMVREMPVYSLLCHESHWLGEWHAVWPGDNLHYNKQYGPTPEAALEAARKEIP
jgi:hypothetical protein